VPWYNPKSNMTKRVSGVQEGEPEGQPRLPRLNVGFTFEAILIAADSFKRAKSTDPKTLPTPSARPTSPEDVARRRSSQPEGQVEGIARLACRT